MKKNAIPILAAVSLAGIVSLSLTALAQAPAPAPAAPAAGAAQPPAGGSLGQQIATRGTTTGAAACASCHGAHGEGNANSGFPRIAGLSQIYLARQLTAFANGQRNNPVMSPIAKALSAQQRDAVAGYYANLQAPWTKPAPVAGANAGRGATLATVGDNSQRVQACANCHGPGGMGEPPNYPYLAGQNSNYLVAALNEWKNGTRKTDPSGTMPTIGRLLNANDINAVAAYYAQQTPPPPAGAATVTPPSRTPARGGGRVTAGSSGATPQTGIGTEQGGGLTGGQEGPGGGGGASGAGPSGSQTGAAPG